MTSANDDVCYICHETFCQASGCLCPIAKMRQASAPLMCGCVRDNAEQLIPVHPDCVLEDIKTRSLKLMEGLFYYKCGYCGEELLMRGLPEIIHTSANSANIMRPNSIRVSILDEESNPAARGDEG